MLRYQKLRSTGLGLEAGFFVSRFRNRDSIPLQRFKNFSGSQWNPEVRLPPQGSYQSRAR